jgi:hypothetical protein
MEEKDFYTLEEIEDEFIGVEGTPRRDKYEADLKAFLTGEAIRILQGSDAIVLSNL